MFLTHDHMGKSVEFEICPNMSTHTMLKDFP
jgi:hypothetical protein